MIMNDIFSIIKKSKRIGITFHTSPDGDALGSSLALLLGLKKYKKDAYIISKDTVPDIYKFLPGSAEVTGIVTEVMSDTDCVFVLDCGSYNRISADLKNERKSYSLINIDHHLSNDLYGDLNFVDTNASATGEIIYQMLSLLGISIDKEIATSLYTSLITDNGSFKYSNTTSVTHTIAGDLINAGINFSEIHRIVFETKGFNRVKLYGKVIENMYLVNNGKICIMTISKKMLDKLNIEMSDTSDIISIGMEIDTVEVAALIKETDNGVKISLRSKEYTDVKDIAGKFGGGGHKKAAGLSLNKDIEEAQEIIINAIEKEWI